MWLRFHVCLVAGSSLSAGADPCLLSLLYGGGAAYQPQPMAASVLYSARAASQARQGEDSAGVAAIVGSFGLGGGSACSWDSALAAIGARPQAGHAGHLPSAHQVCTARSACRRPGWRSAGLGVVACASGGHDAISRVIQYQPLYPLLLVEAAAAAPGSSKVYTQPDPQALREHARANR